MRIPLIAAAIAGFYPVTEPSRTRKFQVRDVPTVCTSTAVATMPTINRGGEGIWVVNPNATNLTELHRSETRPGVIDYNLGLILDACTQTCLGGNYTAVPGRWLPSGQYFQGLLLSTPGGTWSDTVFRCSCYNRALSMDDLVPGAGVASGANPGSGTVVNRVC